MLSKLSEDVRCSELSLARSRVIPDTLRGYLGSKIGVVLDFITMMPAVYYAAASSGANPERTAGNNSVTTREGEDPLR